MLRKFPAKVWSRVAVITLVAGAGIYLLVHAMAAGPSVSLEAENGDVSSPATVQNDSGASGGKAVQFGANTPPPPPPTGGAGPQPMSKPAGAVTPEQFGATGNGTHDDTQGVQSAFNAGAGKTVWLSGGKTYLIKSSLRVPSNTKVLGAGPTAKLKFTWYWATGPDSGGGPYITNKNPGTGDNNVTLSNFVMVGAGTGLPGGLASQNPLGLNPGVRIGKITNFTVSHLEVMNVPGIAVNYTGSSHGLIEYNHVHNSGRDGITGFYGNGPTLSDIDVRHNLVENTGDDGIAVNGISDTTPNHTALPTDIRIVNNTVKGWPKDPNGKLLGRGVALNAVDNVLVQNNTVTFAEQWTILLSGCNDHLCQTGTYDPATGKPWLSRRVRILDNTITHTGGGGAGIMIDTTRDSTITGNTISNPGGQLILNRMCNNCTIQ